MGDTIVVQERGRTLEYSLEDLLLYHGPGSPGGVAQGFKVLERAIAALDLDEPPQRREISVRTAFGGPGARDAVEMVTRAVSEDRYEVDRSLARPELGRERERFVFEVGYRGRTVTLLLRDGFVSPEFIDLARAAERTPEQEARLDVLKAEMAERVGASPADEVYAVDDSAA
jgi:hypothetical protein